MRVTPNKIIGMASNEVSSIRMIGFNCLKISTSHRCVTGGFERNQEGSYATKRKHNPAKDIMVPQAMVANISDFACLLARRHRLRNIMMPVRDNSMHCGHDNAFTGGAKGNQPDH